MNQQPQDARGLARQESEPVVHAGEPGPIQWTVAAAAEPSASHRLRGAPSEDAFRWLQLGPEEGSVVVAAVADGASDAVSSRAVDGAALVCGQAVVETAALIRERRPPFGASADAAREWRELIEAAFRSTRRAFGTVLQYLAAADGRFESPGAPIPGNEIDARLFATTLGLVIVGSEFLVSGAIGTSFVVAQHFDELHLVDSPWGFRGERRSESFITQPNAIEVGRFSYLWDDGLRAVILGTDGLANTAVRESGDGWYVADGEKLRRLLADAASRNSTSLRNSETLRQAAVDDDATAVLILASRKRA